MKVTVSQTKFHEMINNLPAIPGEIKAHFMNAATGRA